MNPRSNKFVLSLFAFSLSVSALSEPEAKRAAGQEKLKARFEHCEGSLGHFWVKVKPSKKFPGTFDLYVEVTKYKEGKEKIHVLVANRDLNYKLMAKETELEEEKSTLVGHLSKEDLKKFDTVFLFSSAGVGDDVLNATPERDALCTLPIPTTKEERRAEKQELRHADKADGMARQQKGANSKKSH